MEHAVAPQPRPLTALPRRRLGLAPAPVVTEHVAILFTDIVGSTALLERLGDVAAHRLRRRHFGLLRHVIAEHGGREVKNLGDGLMVAFADASDAVACGLAIQRAVAAAVEHPLELRIGVAAGEAVTEDGDYFGWPVIVAQRLCCAAHGGDVLVADAALQPATDLPAHGAQPFGTLALKGVREPVESVALRPERPRAVAALGAPA
jgi:class 3 adenylate cyclase